MDDLRPVTGKAEFHITYRCDLECVACSRASFLKEPVVPDMTLEDMYEFFRQADALNWKPRIIVIGGEPTLHRQFKEFCIEAMAWAGEYSQVYSNGRSKMALAKIEDVEKHHDVSIERTGWKPEGSVTVDDGYPGWELDTFVSPADAGCGPRGVCYKHASQICGVSVDAGGYAPCAPGGIIAAMVAPAGRTKVLADLFDVEKVKAMSDALCLHCGTRYESRPPLAPPDPGDVERYKNYLPMLPKDAWGAPLSPTWAAAFKGRK